MVFAKTYLSIVKVDQLAIYLYISDKDFLCSVNQSLKKNIADQEFSNKFLRAQCTVHIRQTL